MTNNTTAIISYLKDLMKIEISGLKLIGEMPDDVKNVSQRMPAVLFRDTDKLFEAFAGTGLQYQFKLQVYLYVNNLQVRGLKMNDLEASVITALLKDFTLGGNAKNIIIDSTDCGGVYTGEIDYTQAGSCGIITTRLIEATVFVRGSR